MKTYLLFLILTFVLFTNCKSKKEEGSSISNARTNENRIEQSEKKNDISIFFEDSIKAGKSISESFLTFKFGDSKSIVDKKIKNLIREQKISKETRLMAEDLYYRLKFENVDILFGINFDYVDYKLYMIQLSNPTGINTPLSYNKIYSWDKKAIVELYKEKYKKMWYEKKYLPIYSSFEINEYENLDGTRYISLIFTEHSLDIIYKDIRLEHLKNMLQKLENEFNTIVTKKDI